MTLNRISGNHEMLVDVLQKFRERGYDVSEVKPGLYLCTLTDGQGKLLDRGYITLGNREALLPMGDLQV